MKFSAIALALALAANDAQAACTIPALGTAAAATAATCLKKTGGTAADTTACGLVTALDTTAACTAVQKSTSTCALTGWTEFAFDAGSGEETGAAGKTKVTLTGTLTPVVPGMKVKANYLASNAVGTTLTVSSVAGQVVTLSGAITAQISGQVGFGIAADFTSCGGVTALDSATACEAVATAASATTQACTYAGAGAACDFVAGTSARKVVAGTCVVGADNLASGASCDLAMDSGYAGTGTTTYTCPRGTCAVTVANAFGAAATTSQTTDATNCGAVTALDTNTACHAVTKGTGGGQACTWTAPTQFTATPTLKATGCAAGAWQNGGTNAATVTCSSCASGKSFAAAAAGALNAATPCTANCPANFYQANNKLATCTKKLIAGTCAAKSITVARATGGDASTSTFVVSAADIAKVKVGMKAVSTGITAAQTITAFVVASKTITLSANVNAALLAAEVVTLTVPDDTTACGNVAASATSTACDAVVQTMGTCAAKVAVTADTQACASASGGTKIACEEIIVATEAGATPKTGGSACTYTAPTAAACTHTAATSIAADVTACAAVTAAENAAATTVCSAVSVAASAALACDYAAASAALTCAACATGKTLAANTKILDSAQTAADCVAAASATAAASSAVSATASVTTAVAAALAAAAVLV